MRRYFCLIIIKITPVNGLPVNTSQSSVNEVPIDPIGNACRQRKNGVGAEAGEYDKMNLGVVAGVVAGQFLFSWRPRKIGG